jgi:DNA repair protein RecO (recombination protein O)
VQGDPPPNLLPWFDLHLLSLAGFQPQLFHCLACEKPLAPTINFLALREGGVLCPQCAPQHNDVEALDVDTLKLLRFFQSQPWSAVAPVVVRTSILRRVESVLNRYLIFTLERHVRSAAFLRRLAAAANPSGA